jgi:hypothetical protein
MLDIPLLSLHDKKRVSFRSIAERYSEISSQNQLQNSSPPKALADAETCTATSVVQGKEDVTLHLAVGYPTSVMTLLSGRQAKITSLLNASSLLSVEVMAGYDVLPTGINVHKSDVDFFTGIFLQASIESFR